MRSLALIALLACRTPAVTGPLTVEITKVPPREPMYCYIGDPPAPPEELSYIHEEDDVVRRVFVHIRQYNEAVTWMAAMTAWVADLKVCMEQQ